MNIFSSGARFHAGQLDRIEDGFRQLGHKTVESPFDSDLIYFNNGPYHVMDHAPFCYRPKRVATVLDIPEHLFPDFDLDALGRELGKVSAVCSISKFVQGQLKRHLDIESTVIYQPTKVITGRAQINHNVGQVGFLHCGRRWDPNKRFLLATQSIQLLGFPEESLACVGSEASNWGLNLGPCSDKLLDTYYRCTDFVFTLGRVEGLSLPTIEAMAAGAIPIVCSDMTTRTEFLPPNVFPEYEDVQPNPASIARFIARFLNDNDAMIEMKDRLYNHYQTNLAQHFSGKAVAEKIIGIYNSLT